MLQIWQAIYRGWNTKNRAEFWIIISAFVIVLASIVFTYKSFLKLVALALNPKNH